MKPGDLVTVKDNYNHPENKKVGIVLDYFPSSGSFEETILVAWCNPHRREMESPHYLQLASTGSTTATKKGIQ